MFQEADLLATIIEQPDDDDLRLIYADWLEEQGGEGNGSRAALIRTQIRLHRMGWNDSERSGLMSTEQELLDVHVTLANDTLAGRVESVRFARGFIDEVELTAFQFLRHADTLVGQFPVTLWIIRNSGPSLEELASSPHLGKVRGLCLADEDRLASCDLERFFAVAPLRHLQRLVLAKHNLDGDGVRVLARAPWMTELRELSLFDNPIRTAGLRALQAAPFTNLRSLTLWGCDLDDRSGLPLSRSAWMANVRELCLGWNRLGDESMVEFAGSTYATTLHTLQLPRNRIGPRGIGALASSPALRSLETLDLMANQIGESGARAIAESPHWQRLSHLDLLDCRIGSEGIVALADSPNLAGVKHLNLQGNTIDHEAVRALARSPHLDRIETLRCDLDVPNQEELEARFGHRVAFG